mmetsp:Transcript_22759/g.67281  ORF Transcript_22759/g.67281 Transcript_22759/m.67281 type:complete len:225 (+) Transcript_22759:1751-2425(+)
MSAQCRCLQTADVVEVLCTYEIPLQNVDGHGPCGSSENVSRSAIAYGLVHPQPVQFADEGLGAREAEEDSPNGLERTSDNTGGDFNLPGRFLGLRLRQGRRIPRCAICRYHCSRSLLVVTIANTIAVAAAAVTATVNLPTNHAPLPYPHHFRRGNLPRHLVAIVAAPSGVQPLQINGVLLQNLPTAPARIGLRAVKVPIDVPEEGRIIQGGPAQHDPHEVGGDS